jgi:hypothetical protein
MLILMFGTIFWDERLFVLLTDDYVEVMYVLATICFLGSVVTT